MCGHGAWALGGQTALVHLRTADTGRVVLGDGIESVTKYCRNCGFLALFAARVLHDDLKEQDASE